jgi:acyl-CoA dehydrogenase
MTATTTPTTLGDATFRPHPVYPDDDRFVGLAAELGAEFAERAAQHDRENSFVTENYERMRQSRYTLLAVPEELGGLGASLRQVCFAQAELAKYCASTALAINMHIYGTLTNAYNWRKGAEAAGKTLRRVVDEGLIIMTSGGSDGIFPTGTAVREDGGFRINARKVFCSQAPVANVLTTMATYDDPESGRVVLLVAIPKKSEGVQMLDTWDALGMRGTGSNDIQLTDVRVADAQVLARRPWGKVDGVLKNALVHFAPTTAAVYCGIAARARDEAVRVVQARAARNGRALTDDPIVQREIGLIDAMLRSAWWSLAGALNDLGEDYALSEANINALVIAKRNVLEQAGQIINLAMDTTGGSSYFKRSPLERAYRDVRAGNYHPLTPEKSLLHAGRLALGLPTDDIW